MKIKGLILACFVAIPLLGGCSKEEGEIKLTYGSEIDTEATEIRVSQLEQMVGNKESFILVLYQGSGAETCTCWKDFSKVIDEYVQDETRIIYKMNGLSLPDNNEYKLSIQTDRPTLSIFRDGVKAYEEIYDPKNNQGYFKHTSDLKDYLNERTSEPDLIYIDEEGLDSLIHSRKVFSVMYEWSTCPDCQYCLPEVVIPYFKNNIVTSKLYIIDLAVEGILLNDGVASKSNESYIEFMNKYGLNEGSNSVYGYTEIGVVPTFQTWEKGEVIDAAVYFNDEISYEESKGYYVSNSFYSSERIENLKYLDGNVTPILGMSVSEDMLDISEDGVSIIKDEFAKLHTPLLEAYFDYYFK
ncbi:MAG: hypothetical protein LUB56_03070 [Coprobacillus sp.]|nr:hypothetical protein [Coprobacillus sp.]